MIHKIRLSNFKSHQETEIKPGLINILIGANNSGKSSIFQALQLLKQSLRNQGLQLIPAKELSRKIERGPNLPVSYSYSNHAMDIGGFHNVLKKGASEMSISVAGERDIYSESLANNHIKNTQIDLSYTFRDNLLVSAEGQLKASKYLLEWQVITKYGTKRLRLKAIMEK
ncbi:MAG TPA: AAA family ATPase [Saprospiraceae bacterium]|nr:AAA family ATPase [Saprospiraceae bacterium]HMQ84272.1 AAA family ATPase [Saprospiraceae bacterium]